MEEVWACVMNSDTTGPGGVGCGLFGHSPSGDAHAAAFDSAGVGERCEQARGWETGLCTAAAGGLWGWLLWEDQRSRVPSRAPVAPLPRYRDRLPNRTIARPPRPRAGMHAAIRRMAAAEVKKTGIAKQPRDVSSVPQHARGVWRPPHTVCLFASLPLNAAKDVVHCAVAARVSAAAAVTEDTWQQRGQGKKGTRGRVISLRSSNTALGRPPVLRLACAGAASMMLHCQAVRLAMLLRKSERVCVCLCVCVCVELETLSSPFFSSLFVRQGL